MATLEHHPLPRPQPHTSDPIPPSSPAFATPAHPIRSKPAPNAPQQASPAPVLPILLPPATLRPIAFRTFTKKHNLNLTSPALHALATFIGKNCGAAWREDGLAEPILDEVAKSWKRLYSTPIVDGADSLKAILRQLEESMSGGKIVATAKNALSRQTSLLSNNSNDFSSGLQRQDSFGMAALDVADMDDHQLGQSQHSDPRAWLKVVNAFDQPRLVYNVATKHFDKSKAPPSFFPNPSQKTELFRQRYHLIHQRVLRNESFQTASPATAISQQWKITSIANLLGRTGTGHLLLGLLTVTPTGTLAINDLTGSIHLDLEQATSIDLVETWLCPGMIVLVDGVYEEQRNASGFGLGTVGGIGGTIGGRFVAFSIGAPRCETRAMTLGITDTHQVSANDLNIGGGFGWIDFLGLGSERAVGSRMRKIEHRLLSKRSTDRINSNKVVLLGECNLDNPQTVSALRRVFEFYSSSKSHSATPSEPTVPLAFVLFGNFTTYASMSSTLSHSSPASSSNNSSTSATAASIPDSILYKESFDSLALLLADFPVLLKHSTWIFVPGDNDAWPSSFSAGASTVLPRQPVPEMFTSRVRRAFTTANNNASAGEISITESAAAKQKGEVIFTTNPSRLSLFGQSCEMVLFRDDVSARMRRNAISLKTRQAEQEDGTNSDNAKQQMDVDVSLEGQDRPNFSRTGSQGENQDDIVMSGALPAPSLAPPASSPPRESTSSQSQSQLGPDDSQKTSTDLPIDPLQEHNNDTTQWSRQQTTPPYPNQKSKQTTPLQSQAQSLVKTLLDQHTLSPFPLTVRPLNWSFATSALSLYPLPSSLVLCDTGMDPWVVRYQDVEVLNTGRVCNSFPNPSIDSDANDATTTTNIGNSTSTRAGQPGKRKPQLAGPTSTSTATAGSRATATWVEFDVLTRRGAVCSA